MSWWKENQTEIKCLTLLNLVNSHVCIRYQILYWPLLKLSWEQEQNKCGQSRVLSWVPDSELLCCKAEAPETQLCKQPGTIITPGSSYVGWTLSIRITWGRGCSLHSSNYYSSLQPFKGSRISYKLHVRIRGNMFRRLEKTSSDMPSKTTAPWIRINAVRNMLTITSA